MAPGNRAHLEKRVEELRWELDEGQARYAEASRRLADPAEIRALVLEKLPAAFAPILRYDPREDAPHVAVFAIGQVQNTLGALIDDVQFVEKYEERRESLLALVRRLDQAGPGESGADRG